MAMMGMRKAHHQESVDRGYSLPPVNGHDQEGRATANDTTTSVYFAFLGGLLI
jgi:hypothetical protein